MTRIRKCCCLVMSSVVLALVACGTTPKGITSGLTDVRAGMGEDTVVLKPIRGEPAEEKVGRFARYEFDLSAIPPGAQITEALLRAYAHEKEVLARNLSAANVGELAPVVTPLAFFEAKALRPEESLIAASKSTVQWQWSAWSVLSVGGGTGARATYKSSAGGWDEWILTEYVRKNHGQSRLLSLAIGSFGPVHGILTRTVLSTAVILERVIYAGIDDAEHAPQLVVRFTK